MRKSAPRGILWPSQLSFAESGVGRMARMPSQHQSRFRFPLGGTATALSCWVTPRTGASNSGRITSGRDAIYRAFKLSRGNDFAGKDLAGVLPEHGAVGLHALSAGRRKFFK